VSYQTHIPDEWRAMRERGRAAATKAEALRANVKRQRAAQWKKALYTAGKVIGWVVIALAALLALMAGLLMASGKPRR
jgi:hypothetical protein